jgi:hypothetical protein
VLINRPLKTAQNEIQISGGILFGEAYIHTQTEVGLQRFSGNVVTKREALR